MKPDYAEAHADRGNALQALGRLEEAVASYDRAALLKPDAPAIAFNRAVALHSLKRCEDALVSYAKAIALGQTMSTPSSIAAMSCESWAASSKRLQATTAIAVAPHDVEALYHRGIGLMELKRPLDALTSYERDRLGDHPETCTAVACANC